MRTTTIVLLALFLIIGCESPQDLSNEPVLFRGQVIQNDRAPFLIDENALGKYADQTLILDEVVPSGTVYGYLDDPTVYAAEGGEVLPVKTWVDNVSSEPVKASATSNLVITYDKTVAVTILEAVEMVYIDENGLSTLFSGSGVILTSQISTGANGFVTLISSAEFSIGGDGGEWG